MAANARRAWLATIVPTEALQDLIADVGVDNEEQQHGVDEERGEGLQEARQRGAGDGAVALEAGEAVQEQVNHAVHQDRHQRRSHAQRLPHTLP